MILRNDQIQTSRQKLPEQLFQLRSVTWTIKNMEQTGDTRLKIPRSGLIRPESAGGTAEIRAEPHRKRRLE